MTKNTTILPMANNLRPSKSRQTWAGEFFSSSCAICFAWLAVSLTPSQVFAQATQAVAQSDTPLIITGATTHTSSRFAGIASTDLRCSKEAATQQHVMDFFAAAAVCLDAKEMERASVAYHVAMLRGAALIQSLDNAEKAPAWREFSAKRLLLEAPIYNWALADIPSLVTQIQSAINWDQENPVPDELQSKSPGDSQFELARQQQRVMLSKAILDLLQNKDHIYLARHEAGAAIRDASWTSQKRERVAKTPVSPGLNDAHDHDHSHAHTPIKPKLPGSKSPSHPNKSKP